MIDEETAKARSDGMHDRIPTVASFAAWRRTNSNVQAGERADGRSGRDLSAGDLRLERLQPLDVLREVPYFKQVTSLFPFDPAKLEKTNEMLGKIQQDVRTTVETQMK